MDHISLGYADLMNVDRRDHHQEVFFPSVDEFNALSPFEGFAFRVTHRMNLGRWKRFWTWCQSVFGAGWIQISTYNLMQVYGLENVEAIDHSNVEILAEKDHPAFVAVHYREGGKERTLSLSLKPFHKEDVAWFCALPGLKSQTYAGFAKNV